MRSVSLSNDRDVPPEGRGRGAAIAVAKNAWLALAIFGLAAIVQTIDGTSIDVSWMITLCEKILDGQKLYVDVIETNPPAAVYIYWPATAAARLIGFRPELSVAFFGFLSIVVSFVLCARILAHPKLDAPLGAGAIAFAALILALLPGREFNQREHLAVIFGLPFFAALIARASDADISVVSRLLAGFCGALMMSIKPYFALIVLPILPYLLWRLGPRKFFASLELYVAACLLLVYVAIVLLCFPDYVSRIAPMTAAIYVPDRKPFFSLALSLGALCWLALGAILVVFDRRRITEPLSAIPALGSVGAFVSFFVQGKGWPYHIYPALALMALAAAPLVLRAASSPLRGDRPIILTSAMITLALAFAFFSPGANDTAPLERLVGSLAPHPKVLQIGIDALPQPVTRRVSGIWAGTPNGLWITSMALNRLKSGAPDEASRRQYESYVDFDREMLIADIEKKSPDAILIDGEAWKNWAFSQPDVAAALVSYEQVGAVGHMMVYGRRPTLRPSQNAQ